MNNIKGRHWVFILGFIVAGLTSIVSPDVASNMLIVLILIGIGILFKADIGN